MNTSSYEGPWFLVLVNLYNVNQFNQFAPLFSQMLPRSKSNCWSPVWGKHFLIIEVRYANSMHDDVKRGFHIPLLIESPAFLECGYLTDGINGFKNAVLYIIYFNFDFKYIQNH